MRIFFSLILCLILYTSCRNTESLTAGEPDGAQLWNLHCSRCHNIPDPTDYSADQWEIVGAHMRARAQVDGQEMKKIVAFLQSLN